MAEHQAQEMEVVEMDLLKLKNRVTELEEKHRRFLQTFEAITDSIGDLHYLMEKWASNKVRQNQKIATLEEEVTRLKTLLVEIKLDGCAHKHKVDEHKDPAAAALDTITPAEQEENIAQPTDNISLAPGNYKDTTLVASQGKSWSNHNMHNWLEKKLNKKMLDGQWKLNINNSKIKAAFLLRYDRDFIWKNKRQWDEEGIWKWEIQEHKREAGGFRY